MSNQFHSSDERQRATAATNLLSKSKSPDYLTDQFRVFKPQDGINTIRLLPRLIDDPNGDPYGFQFYQYYINKKLMCAPDTLDRNIRNPLYVEYNRLYNESPEQAKEFRGTQRRMVFILVFSDDTQGREVQIWPAPVSVMNKILDQSRSIVDNGALIPIEHIESGPRIVIEKTGQGIKTEYKVELEKEPFPIDPLVANELVHFSELFNVPSVEDCEALVANAARNVQGTVLPDRRAPVAVPFSAPVAEAPAPRQDSAPKPAFVVTPRGGSPSVADTVARVRDQLGGAPKPE